VAFDGNGNVMGLVNAANGSVVAQYEYGPFGEVIRATGPMAKVNPFRFSTKYQDDETDLLYYGYRYYDPSTGRWKSRDPIEEQGGLNLYGFVSNEPSGLIDYLGLFLGGIFKDKHKSEIDGVAAALSSLCTDKCIDRCSKKCTESKCKSEARKIAAQYVHRVDEVRKEVPPDEERHCGWLCYEWSDLVMQSLSELKLDCWDIHRTGYGGSSAPGTFFVNHNFVFASVGKSTYTGGPIRDCGKVLDPWENGKPDVFDSGHSRMYSWNFIIYAPDNVWYWNGREWVKVSGWDGPTTSPGRL
jgi:RHS repeat-associated protein